jgi:tRNA (cytidine/uridine-2'-O-)-methyltransferase
MFHIVLVTPEIPPNTGNVIRLAANTGCTLHLVEPLGFSMDDKHMRRAGLDYHEYADVQRHADWPSLLASRQPASDHMFAMSTRGARAVHEVAFQPGTGSSSARRRAACPRPCWNPSNLRAGFACRCARDSAASTCRTRWR